MTITATTVFDEVRIAISGEDSQDLGGFFIYNNGVQVDRVPSGSYGRIDETNPEVMIVVAACRAGTCRTLYSGCSWYSYSFRH